MPSRKQRRRRAKDRRHEYEYVLVDDEGREVDVDEEEPARPARADRKEARSDRSSSRGVASRKPAPAGRGGRKIEPPSWRRVGKRSLIFAPLMYLTVALLNRKQATGAHLVTTAFLLTFFVPFQYVMDTIVYRNYLKRTGQQPGGKADRSKPAKRR